MLGRLRFLIHFGCVLPLIWLGYVLAIGDETAFGADPVKEIEHFLGYTAIIIFCLMFLLGIVLQLLNKNQYQILRRPLGLWAFAWASLHVASFLFLELGFDVSLFVSELLARPYLIFGSIAFLILAMMAITSLPTLKQKLGKRWFSLHQWAYVAIVAAFVHYYWSVKSVTLAPIAVGSIITLIIAWRLLRK